MFYKVNNRFRFKITDKDSEKFNLIKDAEDIMEAALVCRESMIYLLFIYYGDTIIEQMKIIIWV